MFCSKCGKKDTRNRTINESTKICSDCEPVANASNDQQTADAAAPFPPPPTPPACNVDDDETLNNVKFGSLKKWLNETLSYHVAQIDDRLTREIGAVKEDLQNTNKALGETTSEVTKLKKELADVKKTTGDNVAGLDKRTKDLEAEMKKHKTVSENNLKYLINLDRNDRRKNVILFGIPEVDLTIGSEVASTDQEKCELILGYIGVPIMEKVRELFRLGKASEGKVRPIKLKFSSSEDATLILTEKSKLNDLDGHTIYIKPDKTKAEVTEFQRMGKRKQELLQQYPVDEGLPSRVVLDKGVLKLDGVVVDEFKAVQTLF